ncbi:hypothetical protein N656DRAFT_781983 [Canariomyces notabilis]|uniref:Uncharacterized protein n=1 Tax=Canariomyces notabilis TaxID=2074819 RepID=A0AAN6QHI7_9PEZI|nr:hypothetical protein N656DRAFT_781983 [Canariomyces arenarius]
MACFTTIMLSGQPSALSLLIAYDASNSILFLSQSTPPQGFSFWQSQRVHTLKHAGLDKPSNSVRPEKPAQKSDG